jgi:DNA-binding GntR family transcriptional regulator
MATLNDLLVESRKLTLKQKGRPGRSLLGHEAVVEALRRRDPDAAAAAMREHINQIADLLGQTSAGKPASAESGREAARLAALAGQTASRSAPAGKHG